MFSGAGPACGIMQRAHPSMGGATNKGGRKKYINVLCVALERTGYGDCCC